MAGELDTLHKTWKGFKMQKDVIISPEGDFIYAWEIRSIRYLYQRADINRYEFERIANTEKSKNKKYINPVPLPICWPPLNISIWIVKK